MIDKWKKYYLGELISSISDTFNSSDDDQRVIFLNTSDVLNGKVLHNNYSLLKSLPGQAKKRIKRNDILFSEIRPKNKRFAFVDFNANDYIVSTKLIELFTNISRIPFRYIPSNYL